MTVFLAVVCGLLAGWTVRGWAARGQQQLAQAQQLITPRQPTSHAEQSNVRILHQHRKDPA